MTTRAQRTDAKREAVNRFLTLHRAGQEDSPAYADVVTELKLQHGMDWMELNMTLKYGFADG